MIALDDTVVIRRSGRPLTRLQVGHAAAALARRLPVEACPVINLCEDRFHFLVGLVAALSLGRRTLLPQSSAPDAIARLVRRFGAAPLDDVQVAAHMPATTDRLVPVDHDLADAPAVALFTSGSTGEPNVHDRQWAQLRAGAQALQKALNLQPGARYSFVATMPAQHMFGLEAGVMLPLVGGHAVDAARPLLPEDIRLALLRQPEPRGLLTTPLHLRACLDARLDWPKVAFILSATAPLDTELAQRAEDTFGGRLGEIFGSTETGALACRRTASEHAWVPLPGVDLREDGGVWRAWGEHFPPCALTDVLEHQGNGRFLLRGRDTDMVKIAGKRASLSDLARIILSLPGVDDAAVLPPRGEQGNARIMALVVAPQLSVGQLKSLLRREIDPVFLPRPLLKVKRLPRNETGKLPADAVRALLSEIGVEA